MSEGSLTLRPIPAPAAMPRTKAKGSRRVQTPTAAPDSREESTPMVRTEVARDPGAGRRKKRGGDKRERILDAAVRVFAASGFHATRVADVAKAAGVADGTIYLYFASKEELLVSLFEDRVEKLLAFMKAKLARHTTSQAKLRAVIEMQLGLLDGERDLAEVITVILRQSSKLMKEYAQPHFVAYLDSIARVVAEGQQSGEFRRDVSPSLVARSIFGALDGIALTWALGRADRGGLSRASSQLASLVLRGLMPDPEVPLTNP